MLPCLRLVVAIALWATQTFPAGKRLQEKRFPIAPALASTREAPRRSTLEFSAALRSRNRELAASLFRRWGIFRGEAIFFVEARRRGHQIDQANSRFY